MTSHALLKAEDARLPAGEILLANGLTHRFPSDTAVVQAELTRYRPTTGVRAACQRSSGHGQHRPAGAPRASPATVRLSASGDPDSQPSGDIQSAGDGLWPSRLSRETDGSGRAPSRFRFMRRCVPATRGDDRRRVAAMLLIAPDEVKTWRDTVNDARFPVRMVLTKPARDAGQHC